MAAVRVHVGAYMESPSTMEGTNQVQIEPSDSCNGNKQCRSALTFTVKDWHVPQTVAVNAIDDSVASGGRKVAVTHTASSTDASYNTADAHNVGLIQPSEGVLEVSIDEDDAVGVTLSTDRANVTEGAHTYLAAPQFYQLTKVVPDSVSCRMRVLPSEVLEEVSTEGSTTSFAAPAATYDLIASYYLDLNTVIARAKALLATTEKNAKEALGEDNTNQGTVGTLRAMETRLKGRVAALEAEKMRRSGVNGSTVGGGVQQAPEVTKQTIRVGSRTIETDMAAADYAEGAHAKVERGALDGQDGYAALLARACAKMADGHAQETGLGMKLQLLTKDELRAEDLAAATAGSTSSSTNSSSSPPAYRKLSGTQSWVLLEVGALAGKITEMRMFKPAGLGMRGVRRLRIVHDKKGRHTAAVQQQTMLGGGAIDAKKIGEYIYIVTLMCDIDMVA
jgi:hypothetical protein